MGTFNAPSSYIANERRPLNPGACFAAEMEFLPLMQGFIHMEGIRATDISNNESVDLRDLPDIIALDEEEA